MGTVPVLAERNDEKMKHEYIFVLVMCIVFIAGCYDEFLNGEQHAQNAIKNLPPCDYSMKFSYPQGEQGYWVGENAQKEPVCLVRFDNPGKVVDAGL